MRIQHVLFARYAEVNPDGTFTSMGCDADLFSSQKFPAIFPLSILVRLTEVEEKWRTPGKKLPFTLDIRSHLDKSILIAPIRYEIEPFVVPKGFPQTTRPGSARVVVNLGAILVTEPGTYEVLVSFGEEPDLVGTSVPLLVEQAHDSNIGTPPE